LTINDNENHEKSSTTLYIKLFYNFLKFIIRTLNIITKLHTSQEITVLNDNSSIKTNMKKTSSFYTIKSSKSNYDIIKLEDNIELNEKLEKIIEDCIIKCNFALLDCFNFLSVATEIEIQEIIEKEELKNPLIGAKRLEPNENPSIINGSIGGIAVLNDSISSELNTVNISSATTMVDHHKKPKQKFDIKNHVSYKL